MALFWKTFVLHICNVDDGNLKTHFYNPKKDTLYFQAKIIIKINKNNE